jgi:hypothetical protein
MKEKIVKEDGKIRKWEVCEVGNGNGGINR